MIELNCSYEESKKILELGYDFRPVCDQFVGGTENYWKKYLKLNSSLAVYCEPCIELIEERGLRKFIKMENIGKYTIPIIPKAALEACLPDINPSNDERLPDLDICRLRVSKYHTDMCDREHEEIIREFSSVFEAFTWCHENYPKELKKKFEEVMA